MTEHSDPTALSPDEEAEVKELLGRLGRQTAPPAFGRRVEGRIRRRSRGRFFDQRWQITGRPTYLGAAVVLVILAALYFFTQASVELRDANTGLTGKELGRDRIELPQPVPDDPGDDTPN